MRSALAAAALLALAALPAAAQEAPPAPAPEVPAKPSETDAQVLERITGEMMKKVEEIRGLKFKHDVKRVWKSRDEAKTEMLAEIDKQIPPEKLAAVSKTLAFFTLIPEGGDIKQIFADFISAGAGGYYNPDTNVFSLVRGFSEDASRPIVFHELIHAVEDQYYDYNERQEKFSDEDRSDEAAGIQAIVEGSARYWEDQFVDAEAGLREKYFNASNQAEGMAENAKKVMELPPSVVISMVMYPYGNGLQFHQAVLGARAKEEAERAAFDRVFRNPPQSTEQVLHPEKYISGDLPRTVKLPSLDGVLGEGWKTLFADTHGEMGMGLAINAVEMPNTMAMQTMATLKMPKAPFATKDEFIKFQMTPVVEFKGPTAKAIEGWDGDRFVLLAKEADLALGWVSVWDTPEDAAEFAEKYGKVVAKKYGAPTTSAAGKTDRVPPASAPLTVGEAQGTRWSATRNGDSAIVVSGDRVVVLERVPADRVEAAATALLKCEVAQDPKDVLPAKR